MTMKTTLGFIGGGRITRIFLRAFVNRQATFGIMVFEKDAETAQNLLRDFPHIELAPSALAAAKAAVTFIALHPPVIVETLESISPALTDESIVISLAPKITLEKLTEKTGVSQVARMIPNATSYINEGFNPVTFAPTFLPEKKAKLFEMLQLLGNTFEVDEPKLEAYALLSAMLPTYFWFQWDELVRLGSQMGLTEEECRSSVYQTLQAALNLFFTSGLSPQQVMDLIPVKPLKDTEEAVSASMRQKLTETWHKIIP